MSIGRVALDDGVGDEVTEGRIEVKIEDDMAVSNEWNLATEQVRDFVRGGSDR